jgi:LL-diaminopimelate aminotransferase
LIDPAERMEAMASHFFAEHGAKVAALRASGCDVIRLDVGSPDLPPPEHILDALNRSAAAPGHHGYQPHSATPAFRAAWAEMYRRLYAVELDPDREVLPLLGSKEGVFHMAMAHVNPGDVVLVPDPSYITYSRGAQFAGGEPYFVPLLPERGYLPDLQAIPQEIARRAKLLWLNYPNNPTAATASLEFFAEAVDFGRRHGILVCHDAAYAQVTFDGYRAPSILEVPEAKDVAVEFNTLSKSHNMAGWRTGAALGSAPALRALYTLKTNLDSGHFRPVLDAAAEAMTSDQGWLGERNDVYRQRRDAVVPALHELGLRAETPRASLYIWSSVPRGYSSVKFVDAALEQARVSLTPGTVFGKQGEGYVRIALTEPVERMEEAMERLRVAFRDRGD